jgi:transcriptional regulator of met regulon
MPHKVTAIVKDAGDFHATIHSTAIQHKVPRFLHGLTGDPLPAEEEMIGARALSHDLEPGRSGSSEMSLRT